jgi:hypothetical protein
MLFLFLHASFAIPFCRHNFTTSAFLGYWSGILFSGECVRLFSNATGRRQQVYSVFSSSTDIQVDQYYLRDDSYTWDIAYRGIGTSPAIDRIDQAPTTYVYTAIQDSTSFSVTYGDLHDLRCYRLAISTRLGWRTSVNLTALNGTSSCFLAGAAGTKTLNFTIGQAGARVAFYTDKLSDPEWVKGDGTVGIGDHPVLVHVSGSDGRVEIDITSKGTAGWEETEIDFPTEGLLQSNLPHLNPLPKTEVVVIIAIGLLSFLLQIITGYILFKECHLTGADEDATVVPAPSPTGFTQAIRYVDNNIAD